MNVVLIENIITLIFQALIALVFVRAILSWLPRAKGDFVNFIMKITDPMLNPIRHFVPPVGGVDFSPIILFIVLQIIRELLIAILYRVV